jgi:hypothetical protein
LGSLVRIVDRRPEERAGGDPKRVGASLLAAGATSLDSPSQLLAIGRQHLRRDGSPEPVKLHIDCLMSDKGPES